MRILAAIRPNSPGRAVVLLCGGWALLLPWLVAGTSAARGECGDWLAHAATASNPALSVAWSPRRETSRPSAPAGCRGPSCRRSPQPPAEQVSPPVDRPCDQPQGTDSTGVAEQRERRTYRSHELLYSLQLAERLERPPRG